MAAANKKPIYVIDASVLLKWLVPTRAEQDTDIAIALVKQVVSGDCECFQPAHWQADVLGSAIRIQPKGAEEYVTVLHGLRLPTVNDVGTQLQAARMATSLTHHYFDTFYHAVALEHDATYITADEHYFRKSHPLGAIRLLSALQLRPTH
jgi:predicted nucleic acid-binding protein